MAHTRIGERMNVEELLGGLLDRVCDILEADTAAVLLLEQGSDELVARVARGIEEEVHQGVRVPLRQGFAGRIAAERRPVALDRIDPSTVANPILWQRGIRAMLGAPMLSDGRLLGVVHVGRLSAHPFTQADADLLAAMAERVASATDERQTEVQRTAADVLQRSLLPVGLPLIPGMEFAARYVPSRSLGVGGDWYDVFTLPSGELWVVIGDVAGHGLRAAVVMGRVRSAIRSYALTGRQPDEVLALTDESLHHFDPGEMATALCAVFRPPYDEVRLSSSGHPPPVIARAGQPAGLMELPAGPPLGLQARSQRPTTTLPVPPGTLVFFYTDGLVERREVSVEVGLKELCAVVTADQPVAVCQTVMGQLVGADEPEDDVAVLAVRRSKDPSPLDES